MDLSFSDYGHRLKPLSALLAIARIAVIHAHIMLSSLAVTLHYTFAQVFVIQFVRITICAHVQISLTHLAARRLTQKQNCNNLIDLLATGIFRTVIFVTEKVARPYPDFQHFAPICSGHRDQFL